MTYTYEEIIQLEEPYETLGKSDVLAENRDVLNALSDKEKTTLATKIIAACPVPKLNNYSLKIKALRSLPASEETFYSVLDDAIQVKQRIHGLLDHRNKNPHSSFLGKEFVPDLFHRFSDLAKQTLKTYESVIAERLALHTPQENRSQLARNLETAFPGSALATITQTAFTLRRSVDSTLLGEQPELFFSGRDFDKKTCVTFSPLLHTLLKGHEDKIGQKLASIESPETRAEIALQLELLSSEAFDKTNPFKLIASAMKAKEVPQKTMSSSAATNPNSVFGKSKPSPLKQEMGKSSETGNKADEDSDDDSDDAYRFCGLLSGSN